MSGDLAARQAELLAHLLADGPAPAGFDPDRLAVQAAALRTKHARTEQRRLSRDSPR